MNKIDKNKNIKEANNDYEVNFMPSVHVIGRSTMGLALLLAFSPILYLTFVKGYTAPIAQYFNVAVAISAIGIGMWLTEPLAYWPVLGSAGTYIAYLSGNVGAMRFPVALNVQAAMNADITTPRGQVATIVGIVGSVVSNLLILLTVVLAGGFIVANAPKAILDSFAFVMPGLFGALIMINFGSSGQENIGKNVKSALPYLILAIVIKLVINQLPFIFATFGMAIAVLGCVLLAYAIYRRDLKASQANK